MCGATVHLCGAATLLNVHSPTLTILFDTLTASIEPPQDVLHSGSKMATMQ